VAPPGERGESTVNVGLFGGSFDPPHVGHVLGACYALATGELDELLVVPVFAHAFGKPLTAFEHRVALAELAFSGLARARVSTVEATLGAPSRTLRTLEHLSAQHPEWKLRLVVGTDVLPDAQKWLAFDEIVARAPLLVLGRAGAPYEGTPPSVLPEVSSTGVRQRLHAIAGPRAGDPELSRLVPRAVLQYADEHGLYR
jgi:nicotinate-nucleotide adenylyltransferase